MRLKSGGRVDRTKTVEFTFDGRSYHGFRGDTLASALLANGERLVARSFKYHRPRGIMTAGSEEPNALVTIAKGREQEPNLRATQVEIYDGLEAFSQNAWPNLRFDALAANDLLSPFLSAGFYYKTFMWPKSFWEKLYEPFIRRAAGLGALSGQVSQRSSEKAYAFCDLLIIGAGPAGLMAALEAGMAGLDVILVDENPAFGGRLLSDMPMIEGQSGDLWAASIVEQLYTLENVRLMSRTTVTGVYDQGTYGAVERVGRHVDTPASDLPKDIFWRIVARRSILASGALERFVAFPNNDRPGVMAASAVRAYLNQYGVSLGQTVVVFANNDSAIETAKVLEAHGIHIAAYVDSRADASVDGDFPIYKGGEIINTVGRLNLSAVLIRHQGQEIKVSADLLAVSGGWNPNVHLSCHMNARPFWDEHLLAFVPKEGAIEGMTYAGAANGLMSTQACLTSGQIAARDVIKSMKKQAKQLACPKAEDTPYAIAPLWSVQGGSKGAVPRAWVDFQNDVTLKDIRQSADENYRSVEHMKRYTTQGMAPDQGKNSNVTALAILADVTGRSIPETGTTTFRPPYTPVAIAAMGSEGKGLGFAPERIGSTHQVMIDRGAPLIEAGLWYRPSYFPMQGDKTWRQSCDREVLAVRSAVGVCDVSTLGKIDIKGKDASKLLDFVYTNGFSTLKRGRVRYGLMLREDGCVMDDGTTARLGEDHYMMTTTTAAAGEVFRHLGFVHQCLNPHWDVSFSSVTEHWTQFAIAGPKARDLLNGVVETDLSSQDWPFMSCGEVTVMGVLGRLFRISFSGELGYELAVPSRYGESLFRLLLARAEELGGAAYGMEALNVLRLEKGFLTHAEMDGRTTAFDLGLEGMLSGKKEFIGKAAARRPGLVDPERVQLVGLKPVGAVKQLTAGAHLFAKEDPAESAYEQGHVTSVAYSPVLERFHGLAFLKSGRTRHGEILRMVDHVREVEGICEVVSPVAFDPEGGRARV